MASKEMYKRMKNLSQAEIIAVAKECCGDSNDEDFCENKCPYLDTREEETNPDRWCRQWVIHDLLDLIE